MKNHEGIEVRMGDMVGVPGEEPGEIIGFKDGSAVARFVDFECAVYNGQELHRIDMNGGPDFEHGLQNVWVIW